MRSNHPITLWVVLAAILPALAACGRKAPPPATQKTVSYTVRAEIVSVPEAGKPGSEFRARHEEIPDFVHGLRSEKRGMHAMIMPFPLGPSVSIEGMKPGDKVEITFDVDYALAGGELIDSRVRAIRPLPPETVLHFGGNGGSTDDTLSP